MSDQDAVAQRRAAPVINSVTLGDVFASLGKGFSDFLRAPVHGIFFGGIFAAGGILMFVLLERYHSPWLIIPLAIGFPLIGPFAAVGLYETSRRIAEGEPLEWKAILGVVFRQRERELSWMAFVVLFIFWVWIYQVRLLTALFLGFKPISTIQSFTDVVLHSQEGLAFLATGTIVGGLLALALFSVTVISIPMLMEREVDFVTAIVTSVKTVAANPVSMICFGAIVTVLAIAAMIPLFLGLLVVMPVLGHTTWHIYKKAIG
ncbi:MAG: DUF2189 domain-containing protein [Nitratireductor sp.]|nr:DUF2189 domain-containing protein [Nitratireductor sp.]